MFTLTKEQKLQNYLEQYELKLKKHKNLTMELKNMQKKINLLKQNLDPQKEECSTTEFKLSRVGK